MMYKTAALFSILCLFLFGNVGCNILPQDTGTATPVVGQTDTAVPTAASLS
ncbi:MAG: hypothetical protein IPL28_15425 [Chloroflexi bacterium]|nr:hypothetical protein [Chloroflexota bacterium]